MPPLAARHASDSNDVIRDEPVSTTDELERALALAHTARAEQEHPHVQHFDQRAVSLDLHGLPLLAHRPSRSELRVFLFDRPEHVV